MFPIKHFCWAFDLTKIFKQIYEGKCFDFYESRRVNSFEESANLYLISVESSTCDWTGTETWECCTIAKPCKEKEGDCDNDKQCEQGLSCGLNNCRSLNPSLYFDEGADCCFKKSKLNNIQTEIVCMI